MSCTQCPLNEGIQVPGAGPPTADIVFVGEAPGAQELRERRPFIGPSGKLLDAVLEQAGISRSDVFVDNSVVCMTNPPRKPKAKEVRLCRERLHESVRAHKPKVVVALGKVAMTALLGINKPLGEESGSVRYVDSLGTHVIVTYHPAAVLRTPKLHRNLLKDVCKAKAVAESPTGVVQVPIKVGYEVIDNPDRLREFLNSTDRCPRVALDVENAPDNTLLCLGLSVEPGKTVVVTDSTLLNKDCCYKLSNWLRSKTCVGQNIKHDINVLRQADIFGARTGEDTMLASYILDATVGGHGLKQLVREHLDYYEDYAAPLDKYKDIGYDQCPRNELYRYNAHDAALTLLLSERLTEKLDADSKRVLQNILYPASDVLAAMEYRGVLTNVPYLNSLDEKLAAEIDSITKQLHEVAGVEFNPNSVPQLLDVMYKRLELPVPARWSTDKEALQLLVDVTGHPFPALMLEYRARKKFHSTTVRGLLSAVDSAGRAHTTFNLHTTATGRLSSSNPLNLQNVGREPEARNIFIPAPGATMIEIDLKQAEIRGWCWLSRDEALRKAIVSGTDLHTATACLMFGLAPGTVQKSQRTAAKRLSFGVLYQMTPQKLAAELKVSVPEAVELQRKFFAAYSQGYAWINKIQQQCLKDKMYKTFFGRTLRFVVTQATQAEAMRKFVNYPVQNLASDITLSALIRVHNRITRGDFGRTKLLLTVHDSLLLETFEKNPVQIAREIVMEVERDVLDDWLPFEADGAIGPAWGALEQVSLTAV